MHQNDIPDEGQALTSNPLAKRDEAAEKTRQLWELSLFQNKNKQTKKIFRKQKKNSIGLIKPAMFVEFLIITRLFFFSVI